MYPTPKGEHPADKSGTNELDTNYSTPAGNNPTDGLGVSDLVPNKLSLVLYVFGAISALIGLVEIIRLIGWYWEMYGLLANFYLEISIYLIGIGWIMYTFVNFIRRRFLPRRDEIEEPEAPVSE